ncbi:MAG TPA: tetratricopeptide repeat protein [Tepidisphaeraceae bacterium]|nr:tetratricopeptide repeat protein [Tepidisphaeraceae bacterium]
MSEEETFRRKLASLKNATDERPDDGLAWSAFGDFLYLESENPNLAVRAYERAQELLPENDLRLRLGRAYASKGETDKGFAMMQASAAERPRAEAYCFLADAYLRNSRDVEAEEAARRAIHLEPSFEEGHYLLGEALKHRDQAAAIDAYRVALSLDNNYAIAWQGLGRELVNSGDAEGGVDVLRKAVNLDPDDMWSHVFLANGLWKIDQRQEANEQYLAAIALAPEFLDVRRWYAEFLADDNVSERT